MFKGIRPYIISAFAVIAVTMPLFAQANLAGSTSKLFKEFSEKTSFTVTKVKNSYLVHYALKEMEAGSQLAVMLQGSTRETLARFAPKQMSHILQRGLKIGWHQTKRFPLEAFKFYVAIGALKAKDYIFFPTSSMIEAPGGFDQFQEQQEDPIGQFGFLMFMYANGLSSEPLMQAYGNTSLAPFVKYLGMGLGSTASSISAEVLHFPFMLECARESRKGGEAPQNYSINHHHNTRDKRSACDKAYEAWVNYSLSDKTVDEIPILTGMITSTVVAGLIEKGAGNIITKVTKFLAGKKSIPTLIRGGALELMILFAPQATGARLASKMGGVAIKRMRLAYKFAVEIGQLSLFVQLDHLIQPHFLTWWNRGKNRDSVMTADSEVLRHLIKTKKEGWKSGLPEACFVPEKDPKLANTNEFEDSEKYRAYVDEQKNLKSLCENDLLGSLEKFKNSASKWNETNLTKITTAHTNWEDQLQQFMGMQRAAKDFYTTFLGDIADRSKSEAPGGHILIRKFPLHGVVPADYKDDDDAASDYSNNPNLILESQMQTVERVLARIKKTIDAQKNPSLLDQSEQDLLNSLKSLSLPERDYYYKDLFPELSSKNYVAIGWALEKLNDRLGYQNPLSNRERQESSLSPANRRVSEIIRSWLGNPYPINVSGLGYITYYSWKNHRAELLSQLNLTRQNQTDIGTKGGFFGRLFSLNWWKGKFSFEAPTAQEYFLLSMLYGPHLSNKEEFIEVAKPLGFIEHGFLIKFHPPRITTYGNSADPVFPYHLSDNVGRVFNTPLKVGEKTYGSAYEYLLSKESYDPRLFEGTSSSKILDWWEEKITPQYVATFPKFEQYYKLFIREMLDLIKDKQERYGDPLPRGTLASLRRERKVYYAILHEMLKDQFYAKAGQVPKALLSKVYPKVKSLETPGSATNTISLGMIDLVKDNSLMDLSELALSLSKNSGSKPMTATFSENLLKDLSAFNRLERNFGFIDGVEENFQTMESLFEEITNEEGKTLSTAESSDFEKVAKAITENLDVIKALFGSLDPISQKALEAEAKKNKQAAAILYYQKNLDFSLYQKKIVEICIKGLETSVHELNRLGLIINAVADRTKASAPGNECKSPSQNCTDSLKELLQQQSALMSTKEDDATAKQRMAEAYLESGEMEKLRVSQDEILETPVGH